MQHIVLNIAGMTCNGCANSVKQALTALPGVAKVEVSLEHANAEISFDATKTNVNAFNQAVVAAGFEAS